MHAGGPPADVLFSPLAPAQRQSQPPAAPLAVPPLGLPSEHEEAAAISALFE